MTDEPIPDEFGSWARLLPTPEEKPPAAEKPEAKAPAIQAAEEQLGMESTAEETATLAQATDETFADDEPLFARAVESKPSDGIVTVPKAANEIVADLKPAIAVADKVEPKAAEESDIVEKAAGDEVPDRKVPAEAVAHKAAEAKASDKPAAADGTAEEKPAGEKSGSHPRIDEKVKRPFRVKLRGSLLVLVRLPNKRTIQGSFHQLSISGGVIHFEKPLDEKLEVELIFHLKETTIRSKAQMLFPMWATQGWMQPFRFVGLADDNRRVLDQGLKLFVGEMANGASAGA